VLAIFAGGGFVQAYTPSTWGQLNTYEGYAPSVYSPDGTKIATSLNDSRVRILNASTGAVLQTLDIAVTTGCPGCGGSGIQNLVWSPDSSKIALIANTYASKLRLFDVVTAQLLWEKDANNNWYPDYNLLWSPDGKQISFGYQFFDANTGNLIEVFTLNTPGGNPAIIAWSPESRYVITKTGNFIELRNANSGRKILSLFELSGPGIAQIPQKLAIDWNAQSNRIAVTDGNSSVYVYKFSQP
jgi:WD40 repeat protein